MVKSKNLTQILFCWGSTQNQMSNQWRLFNRPAHYRDQGKDFQVNVYWLYWKGLGCQMFCVWLVSFTGDQLTWPVEFSRSKMEILESIKSSLRRVPSRSGSLSFRVSSSSSSSFRVSSHLSDPAKQVSVSRTRSLHVSTGGRPTVLSNKTENQTVSKGRPLMGTLSLASGSPNRWEPHVEISTFILSPFPSHV